MSLQSIALFVHGEAGVPYSTDNDIAYTHDRINRAADELYKANDLPLALTEEYVSLQANASEIFTLPHYVAKLRGLRRPHYDMRNGMTHTGIVPRYQKQTWGNIAFDNIRVVGESATCRDITEEQEITLKLSSPQPVDVDIVITGDTEEESGLVLIVTIPKNLYQVTFSSAFTNITSASKRLFFFGKVSAFEETVTTTPLFIIDSAVMTARYLKIQIQDLSSYMMVRGQYNFELLYKPLLPLMWNANSEFIIPKLYDKAIGWWTISQYVKDADSQSLYMQKAANELDTINSDESRGRKQLFNVGYNVMAETYDRCTFQYVV